MTRTPSAWMRIVLLLICAAYAGGCQSAGLSQMPTEQQKIDMLNLMLPERINIEPFTKVRSFNEDDLPDGILAVVRAYDRFNDPVKAVGLFYFELWTYRNASGDPKGERVAFWERNISTPEEVRLYWTRAQMYEFQLAWTSGVEALGAGRKFLLTCTYRSPWDVTFEDDQVIEIQLPAVRPAAAPTETPAPCRPMGHI